MRWKCSSGNDRCSWRETFSPKWSAENDRWRNLLFPVKWLLKWSAEKLSHQNDRLQNDRLEAKSILKARKWSDILVGRDCTSNVRWPNPRTNASAYEGFYCSSTVSRATIRASWSNVPEKVYNYSPWPGRATVTECVTLYPPIENAQAALDRYSRRESIRIPAVPMLSQLTPGDEKQQQWFTRHSKPKCHFIFLTEFHNSKGRGLWKYYV